MEECRCTRGAGATGAAEGADPFAQKLQRQYGESMMAADCSFYSECSFVIHI